MVSDWALIGLDQKISGSPFGDIRFTFSSISAPVRAAHALAPGMAASPLQRDWPARFPLPDSPFLPCERHFVSASSAEPYAFLRHPIRSSRRIHVIFTPAKLTLLMNAFQPPPEPSHSCEPTTKVTTPTTPAPACCGTWSAWTVTVGCPAGKPTHRRFEASPEALQVLAALVY